MGQITNALSQTLMPLGLAAVKDAFRREVRRLVGKRYQRPGRSPGHVRWGVQRGVIYLFGHKVRLQVPRIRDRRQNREISLESYTRLQQPGTTEEGTLRRILFWLSQRRYQECAEAIPEMIGLFPATVSSGFFKVSARRLQALMERRLDRYGFSGLVLDGQAFAEDGLVLALGMTTTGEHVILGILQAAKEDEAVIADFLRQLIARGLHWASGLRWDIEGSHGLHAAVRRVFGDITMAQPRSAA